MNEHTATCAGWMTGALATCDCPPEVEWQIRRRADRVDVLRYLDGQWTRFMSTPSPRAAVQLVACLSVMTFKELRRVG